MRLATQKRTIIITCLVLSGIMIIDGFNIGHALTMWIIAGIIPGTNIAMEASSILNFYLVLVGFFAARGTNHVVLKLLSKYQARQRLSTHTA